MKLFSCISRNLKIYNQIQELFENNTTQNHEAFEPIHPSLSQCHKNLNTPSLCEFEILRFSIMGNEKRTKD